MSCLICAESFSVVAAGPSWPCSAVVRCLTPCGHNDICSKCHLRLRFLHSDQTCPVCKGDLPQVIVPSARDASSSKTSFEDFQLWGEDLGESYLFHDESSMFFPKDFFKSQVEPLFSLSCQVKGCSYVPPPFEKEKKNEAAASSSGSNDAELAFNQKRPPQHIKPLLRHLQDKHGLTLCVLCYSNKRDFLANLPRMTPKQLKKHTSEGDGPGTGFTGHQFCKFCNQWFYDLDALHKHLRKMHYKCHLCAEQGLQDQYFKDYRSLETHFSREHFLCGYRECKLARFVAFGNEIDFQAHLREVHHCRPVDSKIKLEFKVLRGGFDGSGVQEEFGGDNQTDFPAFGGSAAASANGEGASNEVPMNGAAFVPAPLPRQENEEDISDPNHRARTELMKKEAAAIRERNQLQMDYPTLGDSVAAGAFGGWSGVTSAGSAPSSKKKTMEEEFPTLGGVRVSKGKGKSKSIRKGKAGTGRDVASHSPDNFLDVGSARPLTGAASSTMLAIGRAAKAEIKTAAAPSSPKSAFAAAAAASSSSSSSSWAAQGRGETAPAPTRQKAPTAADFPNLGAPSSKRYGHAKANKAAKAIPHSVTANVLAVPKSSGAGGNPGDPSSIHRIQLDVLKSHLTKDSYKQLKKFTKDFANSRIEAEVYVQNSAVLFNGQGKVFADFMPALISSFPDKAKVDEALMYISEIASSMGGWNDQHEEEEKPSGSWATTASTTSSDPRDDLGLAEATSGLLLKPSAVAVAAAASALPSSASSATARAATTASNTYYPPPPPITYSSSTNGISRHASQPFRYTGGPQKKNAWGGSSSTPGIAKGSGAAEATGNATASVSVRDLGTATKTMAQHKKKERKEAQRVQEQAFAKETGKKKTKKKRQQAKDLQSMIFG